MFLLPVLQCPSLYISRSAQNRVARTTQSSTMRLIATILFVSFITAIYGMVIDNPLRGATAPLLVRVSSLVQWFQTSYDGIDAVSPYAMGKEVTSETFWDQESAEKSAKMRGEYFSLRWNDVTSQWSVDMKGGQPPDNEEVVVGSSQNSID